MDTIGVDCENANIEEEPRTSDGDGVDGADEQMMNTNVQITARPHRRPSPGFDETPTLIKPIPRGSSFFIFSHTNRLAQSANGQTNPISFSFFFLFFSVCVCVRVVRQIPYRHILVYFFIIIIIFTSTPPSFCTYFSLYAPLVALSLSLSLCSLFPHSLSNCCKLALKQTRAWVTIKDLMMMIITEKRRKPKSERRRRKKRMKTGSRWRRVRDARRPSPAPTTKSFPYPPTLPSSYSPTPTGSPRNFAKSISFFLINQTILSCHFLPNCSILLLFSWNFFAVRAILFFFSHSRCVYLFFFFLLPAAKLFYVVLLHGKRSAAAGPPHKNRTIHKRPSMDMSPRCFPSMFVCVCLCWCVRAFPGPAGLFFFVLVEWMGQGIYQ